VVADLDAFGICDRHAVLGGPPALLAQKVDQGLAGCQDGIVLVRARRSQFLGRSLRVGLRVFLVVGEGALGIDGSRLVEAPGYETAQFPAGGLGLSFASPLS
jgi:hypothetical protein